MNEIFLKIRGLQALWTPKVTYGLCVYDIMQTLWDYVPLQVIFKFCLDNPLARSDELLANYRKAIPMIETLIIRMNENIAYLRCDCDAVTQSDCDKGSSQLKEISDAISTAQTTHATLHGLTATPETTARTPSGMRWRLSRI